VTSPLPLPLIEQARALLVEDRTGYREAARTVRCHPSTLTRRLPGLGLTQRDGGQIAAATVRASRAGVRL
jgi:hypothetical protein